MLLIQQVCSVLVSFPKFLSLKFEFTDLVAVYSVKLWELVLVIVFDHFAIKLQSILLYNAKCLGLT